MSFPYHAVPDGNVFAAHHIYIGAAVALGVARVLRDDVADEEPWVVTNAVWAALFAFVLVWPHLPALGAALTLAGLTVACAAQARPFWRGQAWRFRVPLALGLYIALDDAVEHAFGWPMPLDVFWKVWLYDFAQAVNNAMVILP